MKHISKYFIVTWNEYWESWSIERDTGGMDMELLNQVVDVPHSVTGGNKRLCHVYVEAKDIHEALYKGNRLINPSVAYRKDFGQI